MKSENNVSKTNLYSFYTCVHFFKINIYLSVIEIFEQVSISYWTSLKLIFCYLENYTSFTYLREKRFTISFQYVQMRLNIVCFQFLTNVYVFQSFLSEFLPDIPLLSRNPKMFGLEPLKEHKSLDEMKFSDWRINNKKRVSWFNTRRKNYS